MPARKVCLASACVRAFLLSCGALYVPTSNLDGRGRPTMNDDRITRLVPESKAK